MEETEIVKQVLFLRAFVSSLQENKKNVGLAAEVLEVLEFVNVLWAEYSVLKKQNDECHAKLQALSAFCGVR